MDLKGTVTALITPFKGEALDREGFERNIAFQLECGVDGILPLGTTGESPTLSAHEKEVVIQSAVKLAKGKVPVWVGTGSNSTVETIEKTRHAEELGADIALIVTPYYNKPMQEGIYRHFKAVAEATSLPIVLYNIEGRCGRNIETSTLKRLAEIPSIVGVKEASGNVLQMSEVIRETALIRDDFAVFSGDDALTFPLMALGGVGGISVVSNLVPKKLVAMTTALLEKRYDAAREMHHALFPLFRVLFIEVNPVPIKEAMALCGMAAGKTRLPLCEMLPENRKRLEEVLKAAGLL